MSPSPILRVVVVVIFLCCSSITMAENSKEQNVTGQIRQTLNNIWATLTLNLKLNIQTSSQNQPPPQVKNNENKEKEEKPNSKSNPGCSCKGIHDKLKKDGKKTKNGVYWIGDGKAVQLFCDMEKGGLTLVGKISGQVGNVYDKWLISNQNVDDLQTPKLPNDARISCIDARYLATHKASAVILASGEKNDEIGGKWVRWSLPAGRSSKTLWTHSVGQSTIAKEDQNPVTVTFWTGSTKTCYQNKYGIMPLQQHGGSYPYASLNKAGNTQVNDICMAVGVQARGKTADGFSQNANGYDSPKDNSHWPNSQYNHQMPYLDVWLE